MSNPISPSKPTPEQRPAFRVVATAWLDTHDPGAVDRFMDDLTDWLCRPGVEFSVVRSEPVDPDTGEPVAVALTAKP